MTDPSPREVAGASHGFRVLLSRDLILRRIRELADRITGDFGAFAGGPPTLVAVVEGARTFARQIRQRLPGQPTVHEIRASSYGNGTSSSGKVAITGALPDPVRDRSVLLFEDIVDTGRTVDALRRHFLEAGAADFRVASLLSKPSRRVVEVALHYVGFEIPDEFVVGFGMDYAGRFRELPEVVVYEHALDVARDS